MFIKKFLTTPFCSKSVHSLVRKPAPKFATKALVNGEFKQVKSEDFNGKYWVLFFYPLDFTFVCPTEIVAFNDKLEEFRRLGCEVVGASVDSEFSHLAWTQVPRTKGGLGPLRLPLLADLTKQVSRDYGVLVEETGFSLRGLFVVDKQGIVRHATINDTGIGRSVDEVLRVVQAVQHVDQHGEVCPANWKPTDPAIDPKNAQKYFSKNN
jgi:alkyl hydroperoxide reductase subunit AhpC